MEQLISRSKITTMEMGGSYIHGLDDFDDPKDTIIIVRYSTAKTHSEVFDIFYIDKTYRFYIDKTYRKYIVVQAMINTHGSIKFHAHKISTKDIENNKSAHLYYERDVLTGISRNLQLK